MSENLDAVLDPATPPRRDRAPKASVLNQPVEPPKMADGAQPVASSRSKTSVTGPEGPPIRMRVTAKGDMQISAGSDHGFDRYRMFAEFTANDVNARSLYNKGWAEPLDNPQETVMRWEELNSRDKQREAASLRRRDELLEKGAPVGVTDGWG